MTGKPTQQNYGRRMEDHSITAMIRDKVIPPLIVAAIIGGAAGGWAAYRKLDDITVKLPQMSADISQSRIEITQLRSEIARTQNDLTVLRAQMVGWDVLKRVELALASLAKAGAGDRAMHAVSDALRAEIDARKEKP